MPKTNAFVTPPYPVLFSVGSPTTPDIPEGEAELLLALLICGMPSFLAAHRVPEQSIDELVVSLQQGDPRVAVAGSWVDAGDVIPGRPEKRAAAFVGLICADGRRITVARVLGEDPDVAPNVLAGQVIRQIARGVQVPDLAGR